PILFLARRAWRALAAFAGVLAGLGLISVAGFGIGPVTTYLTTVGTWAATGRLPSTGHLVYTDPAVYSLRNILDALPGGGKAAAVLFFAYSAIDLTLAINFWSAAVGALAIAGYLTIERMAVRPDPIPLGELQWSGPRPRRVIVLPAYRAAKTLAEVVGDIPQG